MQAQGRADFQVLLDQVLSVFKQTNTPSAIRWVWVSDGFGCVYPRWGKLGRRVSWLLGKLLDVRFLDQLAMERREIKIDLDKILDVAHRGVRRASVFMGLGVNAALDADFKQYLLTHITKLQLVSDNVDLKTLGHFKEEFKTWVEGNGLRELLETFSVFLDRIYEAVLLVSNSKDKLDLAALAAKRDSFNRKGFPNKLNILRAKYAVGPKHSDYLVSINRARNCLSHRRGIVGHEDVDESAKLRVAWLGMDIYAETPSGERHSLIDIPPGGLLLPDGGTVCMQFVEREKLFDRGTPLRLSTRDLAEICWFFQREAITTGHSVIGHAQANGVSATVTEKSNEAVQPTPEAGAADLGR